MSANEEFSGDFFKMTEPGRECPVCRKHISVGDVVALVGDEPADEVEARRKSMGRPYTACASIVHKRCIK